MQYNEKENGFLVFYFSGLPVLDTLSEIPKNYEIKNLNFLASDYKLNYLYTSDLRKKDTINDLIRFLKKNSDYSIDDLDAVLQNDIEISVHDDNEITFSFPKTYKYIRIINKILNDFNFNSKNVLSQLKENKNQYLSIIQPDRLIKKYADFQAYCNDNE